MDNVLWLLLQTVTRESERMPFVSSWAGIVSLVLSVLALAGGLIGYGRWLEKLNGVGRRVAALETEHAAAGGEREAAQRELTRTVDALTALTREMGRHERGVDACREDTEQLGISIGSEVHALAQTVASLDRTLSVELAKVQTILKERGIGQ